ncbi:MAG: xanthine dehydrogenase accessory protein XdhC [Elusimicrobiota bacterium]
MESAQTLGDFSADLPRPAVMCTIVKVTGSAPQPPGVRMWVAGNRVSGTLGGGEFERQVLEYARGLLQKSDAEPHVKEYVLCKEMGQCCGGRVEIFFEPVSRRKAIHIFGGGHVGRALAHVLSKTPFDLHVVDSRPEWAAREGLPEGVLPHCVDALQYARGRQWSEEDAVCLLTHSHDLDFALVKQFLPLPTGYLGMIGSDHKATVFQTRLAQEKKDPETPRWIELWDEKMHCPIGLEISGKDPKIIAISIAAEVLQKWGGKVCRERV